MEEATSFHEAVEICAQYSIPTENDSVGLKTRDVLVPWMRCMETTFRTQPDSRGSEPYALFYPELSKTHSHMPVKAENVAVKETNLAAHAIFRSVLAGMDSQKYSFPNDERKAIKEALPGYSLYLDSVEVSLR